jgi:Zn-dependent peptidase ImmA (M78 family)
MLPSLSPATEEEIRRLARSHLRRFGMLDRAPTNLRALVQEFGIRLLSRPCWPQTDWTGLAFATDGYQAILVNSLLIPGRWAFTVAHELGHIVLGHVPSSRARTLVHERMADVYASEILMPRPRVLAQIQQYGTDVALLARLNGVSRTAMDRCLEDLLIPVR